MNVINHDTVLLARMILWSIIGTQLIAAYIEQLYARYK